MNISNPWVGKKKIEYLKSLSRKTWGFKTKALSRKIWDEHPKSLSWKIWDEYFNPSVVKCAILFSNPWIGKNEDF